MAQAPVQLEQQKLQLLQELEIEMMADMYNRLTSTCHKKCIPPSYGDSEIAKAVCKQYASNIEISAHLSITLGSYILHGYPIYLLNYASNIIFHFILASKYCFTRYALCLLDRRRPEFQTD
ncbi:hypothetical protein AMK59_5077, partial [Oryctes borbonicus]